MSGFVQPTTPNVADYTTWLVGQGFLPQYLPAGSSWIEYALNQALIIVNQYGQCIVGGSPNVAYTLAVYNCATHIQVKITPDVNGQTFFQTMRGPPPGGFNMLGFVPGVVQASADQGTSSTLVVPEFFKNLTIGDLNFLLTPWGREYLAYAQDFGDLWGLS